MTFASEGMKLGPLIERLLAIRDGYEGGPDFAVDLIVDHELLSYVVHEVYVNDSQSIVLEHRPDWPAPRSGNHRWEEWRDRGSHGWWCAVCKISVDVDPRRPTSPCPGEQPQVETCVCGCPASAHEQRFSTCSTCPCSLLRGATSHV